MSNKRKFPKKMVQARAQGKSKEFGDSDTVEPVTHNHINYETDEPLATSQANRKPDREYPFDLITGGPSSGTENASVAVVTRAEQLRQLKSFSSAGPADPLITSDAESVRSMQRPRSQAIQQSNLERKKANKTIEAQREPDGPTEDTTTETTMEPGPGPPGVFPSQERKRVHHVAQYGVSGYYTDNDQVPYGGDEISRSISFPEMR